MCVFCLCMSVDDVTNTFCVQSDCWHYPGSLSALGGAVQVCVAVSEPCLGTRTSCTEGTA